MANVLEVNEKNFEAEVLRSDLPVLVDFTATWCGPCRQLAPVIEEIASDYSGRLKVAKLDIDQARNTAAQYGIMSVPTVILFVDGAVREQVLGAVPKLTLTDKIDQVVG